MAKVVKGVVLSSYNEALISETVIFSKNFAKIRVSLVLSRPLFGADLVNASLLYKAILSVRGLFAPNGHSFEDT